MFSDDAAFGFSRDQGTQFNDNYLTSEIRTESYQSLGNNVLQFSNFNLDKFRWEMLNNNNRVSKDFVLEWFATVGKKLSH